MKMKNYRVTTEEDQLLKKIAQENGISETQLFKKKIFEEPKKIEMLEKKILELENKIDLHFAETNKILEDFLKAFKSIKKRIKKKRGKRSWANLDTTHTSLKKQTI